MIKLLPKLLRRRTSAAQQLRRAVYTITRLRPSNLALYQLALQHSSAKADAGSNERLEFLGDAVLSLIIGEYLFKKYPLKGEGFLTEIRSRIVNRASLGSLAKKMGIDALLCYDQKAIARGSSKFIYGNALEALIGAVYLDRGYQCCRGFVLNQLLRLYIDLETLIKTDSNYKSQLAMWASRNHRCVRFTIAQERMHAQIKEFTAQVIIEDQVVGQGQGSNKKQAEQQAARAALGVLSLPNA